MVRWKAKTFRYHLRHLQMFVESGYTNSWQDSRYFVLSAVRLSRQSRSPNKSGSWQASVPQEINSAEALKLGLKQLLKLGSSLPSDLFLPSRIRNGRSFTTYKPEVIGLKPHLPIQLTYSQEGDGEGDESFFKQNSKLKKVSTTFRRGTKTAQLL